MRKKLLCIIPICIFFLAGIGIFLHMKKPAKPILCHVEVPAFPVVANPNSAEDTPSQVPGSVKMESTGAIKAYTIHDDVIYYIIAYDFGGYGWAKQFSVFKQPLTGDGLEKLTDYTCDRYLDVTRLWFDESLKWMGYDDEYAYYRYTLIDEQIEEIPCEEEQDADIRDVVRGFHVGEELLIGYCFVCGEDDEYVVWEQEPYSTEEQRVPYDVRWNVLDKKKDKVSTYSPEKYGDTYVPILCKGNLFFQAFNAIEDADATEENSTEEDFADDTEDICRLNLATGKMEILTPEYHKEEGKEAGYDFPESYGDGICFVGWHDIWLTDHWEYDYAYMYFMELE